MTDALTLDSPTTALLVMDFQTSIVEMIGEKQTLLARTAGVIEAARRKSTRIVYVVVGFRPGYPEVSSRNQSFSAIRGSGRFVEGAVGSEIHPSVSPRAGDVIVTKHRVSAFAGTDLEMLLRANGAETLILAGIATSGVVLSTLRHAADADYRLIVAADCCADRDDEVHRVLMEKVFPRQATVATAQTIVEALS